MIVLMQKMGFFFLPYTYLTLAQFSLRVFVEWGTVYWSIR